jgi:hypothetical protein
MLGHAERSPSMVVMWATMSSRLQCHPERSEGPAQDGLYRSAYGVMRSVRYSSSTASRARATHQRPPSTTTSAGRGRVL